MIPLKSRTCKAHDTITGLRCNAKFIPDRPFVKWCSHECGLNLALELKAKKAAKEAAKQRKELRARKEKARPLAWYVNGAQAAFNKWIRARDADLPCVSCGSTARSAWDAGHFRSRGSSPALKFEPLNVHKQCVQCNQYQHGNLVNFRIELIKRIGIGQVEWLEGPHEPAKYTVDDLKVIKALYTQKLKELLAAGVILQERKFTDDYSEYELSSEDDDDDTNFD